MSEIVWKGERSSETYHEMSANWSTSYGTIMAPGPNDLTAIFRVMGLAIEAEALSANKK
jgi:hypothetical protein